MLERAPKSGFHSRHFGGGKKKTHFKERKTEGFSQNNAMQFGKVPTLKGGGAESNKECAPISGIFVENGQFSKKECAPISQTSKIAFPISKISGHFGGTKKNTFQREKNRGFFSE